MIAVRFRWCDRHGIPELKDVNHRKVLNQHLIAVDGSPDGVPPTGICGNTLARPVFDFQGKAFRVYLRQFKI